MESPSESGGSSGGEKTTGVRSKTSAISTSTRIQRNQAEKQRRDRLNGYISDLATLVPMVSNATKPLDKVSILRLSAAQIRLNYSCLNPKKSKCKPVALPPQIISYLDVIEKTIGGFILVTTFSGCVVFCSKSIEDYVGYQNIDVIGNSVFSYIHSGDASYFEKKVNSVINGLKRGPRKKSKVIKAHMQQRPLPRSNDVRYRKMLFKISVHLNDQHGSTNGHKQSHAPNKKKSGRLKDFGSSAVLLMFIEPVRLEPEIDISYIESHQDAYFTMHGLQGEIIYADQRISSITGYMPHDVQGVSAYQFICSSDVPIALFAQKAMFTSNDGTGVIVYRLRIRDMRFIYLQSSGQIAYKDSSSDVSHFVCFNKLLSDDEGSQELKRFQQRFAPQIMAAKMLKGKQNDANGQTPNPDLSLEHTLALLNSKGVPEMEASTSLLNVTKSPEVSSPSTSGHSDRRHSSESSVSPSSSATTSYFVHSSDGQSLTSPPSDGGSGSAVSEYNGQSYTLDAASSEFSDQLELAPQQPKQKRPPTRDCSPPVVTLYDAVNGATNEINFAEDHQDSGCNGLGPPLITNQFRLRNDAKVNNSSFTNHQSNIKAQSETSHSVNVYSSLQNSIIVNDTSQEAFDDRHMDFVYDCTLMQDNVSFNLGSAQDSSSYIGQTNGMIPQINGQCNDYVDFNGHVPYDQTLKESRHFVNFQNGLQEVAALSANPLRQEQRNFNSHQTLQNGFTHSPDLLDFPEMCKISSNSSLWQNSNPLPAVSGLCDTVDYYPSTSLCNESDNFSTDYLSSSDIYNVGANGEACNDVDVLKSKTFSANHRETNGYHGSSIDDIAHFPSTHMINSAEVTAFNNKMAERKRTDVGDASQYPRTLNMKLPTIAYPNGNSDAYSTRSGPHIYAMDWNGGDIGPDPFENVEPSLKTELYRELDVFFQAFPPPLPDSCIGEKDSEFRDANGSYLQNGLSSSRAKTNYHR